MTPTPKHIAQRLAEDLIGRMFTPAVRGFAGSFACEHAVLVLSQRLATLLAAQEELETCTAENVKANSEIVKLHNECEMHRLRSA